MGAWTLFILGYADQALKQLRAALSLAQKVAHPFSLALGLILDGRALSVPPRRPSHSRASRGGRGTSAVEKGAADAGLAAVK